MMDENQSTGGDERAERLRAVIEECLRRRAAGQSVSDESLIDAHQELMPKLAEELKKLQLIGAAWRAADEETVDDVGALGRSFAGAHEGLHIRCPHCNNRIELVADAPWTEITCDSCGSRFSLAGDETVTADKSALSTVGHFELVERLGMGGFGTVWKARDLELDRTVAVKIPRRNQLDSVGIEQFMREARAAAQLTHPNIVGVHEVGRDGETIYIVSDLVRGVALSDYVTAHKPTAREAAQLCVTIAGALHYAHEAGVVHRDLKPSNIMIDGDGQPHVMDFGLAKREAGEITMTVDGQVLGTPAYMSPEQARGESHRADRRSDVYSLGVVLFELLTGELPFRGNRRMLMHQVLHDEAPSPRKLNSTVARDLETICLKCMEKEPANRYASAQDFADELRRYLQGRPILARPVSHPARLWRWSRRNPVVAALSAVSLVLLTTLAIGGPLVAFEQVRLRGIADFEKDRADDEAETATAERDNAREEVKEHRQTLRAYVDMVGEAELLKDPRFAPLKQKLLKDALDHYQRFVVKYRDDPGWAPDVAEALYRVASISAETLGASRQEALTAYKEALSINDRLARENPTVTAYSRRLALIHDNIGLVYRHSGNPAKALAAHQQALQIRERLARQNPAGTQYQNDLAVSHNNIALVYGQTGRPVEALAAYQQALEIQERLARENPTGTGFQSDLAQNHNNVGLLYSETGKRVEALAVHQQALEIRERLARENPTRTDYQRSLAQSHNNIGLLYSETGKPAEALAAYQQALEIQERLARENPTITQYQRALAAVHNNIGALYSETGSLSAALAAYQQALEIQERLARENPAETDYQSDLAQSHNNIGLLYRETGKRAEALAAHQRALEIRERLARENPTVTQYQSDLAGSHNDIGVVYVETSKPAEALAAYQQALQIQKRLVRENPSVTEYQSGLARSHNNVGLLHSETGKRAEALAAHQQALEIRERLARENPTVTQYQSDLAGSHTSIGLLRRQTGMPSEALTAYQKALEIQERLARGNPTLTEYATHLAGSLVNLADLNRRTIDSETALASSGRAISILGDVLKRKPRNVTARRYLRNAHLVRAKIYEGMKNYQAAAVDREKASELDDGRSRSYFRFSRIMSLARDGQYQDAIVEADRLAAQVKQPSEIYHLACVYSVCAAAASKDTSLNETLRTLFSDAYAEKALVLLKRAAEASFFQDKPNRKRLTTDDDLAALRGREDFQEFLKSLDE